MSRKKILVVDDEIHIQELIKFNLEKNDYTVICAGDGITALKLTKSEKIDLVILDLMLPGMDGYDVCREIRKDGTTSNMPILMLTAKSEEIDKILGFELGSDDYLTKPFSIRELLARVKALLRRSKATSNETKFNFGNISVDFEKHEIFKGDKKVDLTFKEFELLQLLIKNKGKVLTRELLLDKIWGYEYIGETRTVDVHVRHLRQKIEENDKNPEYIETVRGIGYKFKYGD